MYDDVTYFLHALLVRSGKKLLLLGNGGELRSALLVFTAVSKD